MESQTRLNRGHRTGHRSDQLHLTTQQCGQGRAEGPVDMLTVMHKTESYNGGGGGGKCRRYKSSPLRALSVLVVHAVICISAIAPL